MQHVMMTRDKAVQLLRLYEQAVKDGRESFTFEGCELLTDFAKFLVEFCEVKFGPLK